MPLVAAASSVLDAPLAQGLRYLKEAQERATLEDLQMEMRQHLSPHVLRYLFHDARSADDEMHRS